MEELDVKQYTLSSSVLIGTLNCVCAKPPLRAVLRPCPHVAGYFQKRRFFSPYLKEICIHT